MTSQGGKIEQCGWGRQIPGTDGAHLCDLQFGHSGPHLCLVCELSFTKDGQVVGNGPRPRPKRDPEGPGGPACYDRF